MSWKTFVRDYLTFSKKERIGVIALVIIIFLMYGSAKLFKNPIPAGPVADTAMLTVLDSLQRTAPAMHDEGATDQLAFEPSQSNGFTDGALFKFDPNILPIEGWRRLGLNERTSKTINNYRSKGGRFYKPEDLQKIWGLPAGFYERVAPYITIAQPEPPTYKEPNFSKTPYMRPERRIAVLDVNRADTADLIALPGIGPTLASRIITFRNRLGGFYSAEQLRETYGLPDSTYQTLKPYLQVHGEPKKFDLNMATKDELRAHPYIKWALANAIVEYRNQHGPFKKLDELKNIMLIDEATYNKIAPYFSL